MSTLLAVAILSALVGALVGRSRGLTAQGFLGGLVLGPVGVLLTALSKPKGMRRCPYCAEQVKAEATVCRYCRSGLTTFDPTH